MMTVMRKVKAITVECGALSGIPGQKLYFLPGDKSRPAFFMYSEGMTSLAG